MCVFSCASSHFVRKMAHLVPARSQTRRDLETRLFCVEGWQTATRDDGKVALELSQTRNCDRVHALDRAGFFDELFDYLHQIGAWSLLEELDPQDRKRASIPYLRFVLLTLMRCVGGVQSMLAMHDLLLADEGLMKVVGFNAVQVQNGTTERGVSRRQKPVEIRGAVAFETVADNIVKLGVAKLEKLFNGLTACLAEQHIFPKKIDCVLDTTDNEATPTYKTEDGNVVPKVVREKRPDVRFNRHVQKTKTTVFGWKVWIVWEPVSKIPLAIRLAGIQESDNRHAYEVLEQAKKNVHGYSTIRSIALDRGFLDGKLLWEIDQEGTYVYIPAKSNLNIATDAREIARRAAAEAACGRRLDGCDYRERHETVTVGSGKNKSSKVLTTIVVGIDALPCDFWNEHGSATSAQHNKRFEPKRVRATVVLQWDGQKNDDKEVVILTTNPAKDPWVAFDAYDDRSLIENTCNREAKESYFLEHHPKRSEAGVRVQTYFVFFCMSLVSAFRAHKAQTDKASQRQTELGATRYRRELERQNRDKVAVFIGPHFGIFRSFEVCLLVGINIREHSILGHTVDSVLERCGVVRPLPNLVDSS